MFANGAFSIDEDIILSFHKIKTKQEEFPNPKKFETKYAGLGENLSDNSEAELLRRINQGLSPEVWRIYNDFLIKRRAEVLTANETETLAKISDDIEWINNHRLLLIIELADLRKKELEAVFPSFSRTEKIQFESSIDSQTAAAIIEKSNDACEYCRSRADFSLTSFSIEMIVPQSKGGKPETQNLALICQGCGNRKYQKTEGFDLLKNEKSELFNPRKDIWEEHFSWTEEGALINGLTAKGRASINELKINRPTLVEQRTILKKIGKHSIA